MSEIFKQTVKVGNASDYPWIDSAGSFVYEWKPKEVKELESQKDAPRDAFGRPKVAAPGMEPRDKDGNIIKAAEQLVVKVGGDLQGIIDKLFARAGCPLFVVNGNAEDKEREAKAKSNFLSFKLDESRKIMERWRTRVFAIRSSGGTTPAMPLVEYEADQFLVRYGSMGSLNMKRFLVDEDGASFDYEEDARAHLVHPMRYPQFADEWQKHIKDTQPELPKPSKFGAPAVREYNATTKSLLAEAVEAEIILPQDLVERVDAGDRAALREALEMLSGEEETDPPAGEKLKPWQIAQAAKAAKKAEEKARAQA